MMIYEIEISTRAENDLRDIYEYIAFELQSPDIEASQLKRFEEKINALNQLPWRFRAYEKEPWHSRGLRVMPVDNFVVFYIPNKEKMIVSVIRIMYAGRNIKEQLDKHTKL